MLPLDSDNGSKSINHHLYTYRHPEGIAFIRSPPYKKNDISYIAQQNGSVLRCLLGYDRYSSRTAFDTLNALHDIPHLYVNSIQPIINLLTKARNGTKVHTVHHSA
jgi:hypothetical protein